MDSDADPGCPQKNYGSASVADPNSGFGAVLIPDPAPRAWVISPRAKKPLFGLKNFNFFFRIWDPGWKEFGSGIRDVKNSDPGSGMENIWIRDLR
jgi:hypothetical protein